MAKQEVGRAAQGAGVGVVDLKQQDVALLLKKKVQEQEVAAEKAAPVAASEEAAAAVVAAAAVEAAVAAPEAVDTAPSMFAAAEAGVLGTGLSTGAAIGIGAAVVGAGLLIAEASDDDDDNNAAPAPVPAITSVTPSATSINEGQAVTFTIVTKDIAAGTVINYQITGVDTSDIDKNLSGTITVAAGGTTTFTVTALADQVSDGADTMKFSVNIGSATQTATVAIADTSGQIGSGNTQLKIGEDRIIGTGTDELFTAPAVQSNGGALASTLETVDNVDGGAGNDRLTATLVTGGLISPRLSNIETVEATFSAAAQGLDLLNATGITTLSSINSNAGGFFDNVGAIANLTIKNTNAGHAIDASTATALNLNFGAVGTTAITTVEFQNNPGSAITAIGAGGVTKAAATSATITMDGSKVNLQGDGFKTATINVTGKNTLSMDSADDLTTLTVGGAGTLAFNVDNLSGALTKLDASGNTGGVTFDKGTVGSGIVSTKAVTVLGGSGNDTFRIDAGTTEAGSSVTLGAGDDRLFVGAQLGQFKGGINGGDGTDLINITDGATLTGGAGGTASFLAAGTLETLDVSGGKGVYDMSLYSFKTVQIDEAISGALAAALTFKNTSSDFTFNVLSKAATGADFALGFAQTVTLKDATGTADKVTINVTTNDGNNNSVANGNVVFTGSTTAAGVETIAISSKAGSIDTGLTAGSYKTSFDDLVADSIKTLTVGGDTAVFFTKFENTGNTLATVDASGSSGAVTLALGVTINGATAGTVTSAVNYVGSSGVDSFSQASGGGSIYGGGSRDLFDLTSSAGKADVLIYKAASEATVVTTATNTVDLTSATAFENVIGFVAGTGTTADKINLAAVFGFSGDQKAAVANKGALAGTSINATIADFFADAGFDRAVAFGTNGGHTFVFVDADKNGDLNFSATGGDFAIKLTTPTGTFTTDNVVFG
jgi:hypothetical protein